MSKSALELTVLLKTGESKQFIKAFDTNKTCLTLDNLHKNCVVLQKEVNDFLTTLVEQERGVSGVNNASKTNGEKMCILMILNDLSASNVLVNIDSTWLGAINLITLRFIEAENLDSMNLDVIYPS